ncbi:MAG: TolC family protein [Candidatus Obscuribacter sp.]|nr:TolC family protein [Candidatus Obscuribacter sp.]
MQRLPLNPALALLLLIQAALPLQVPLQAQAQVQAQVQAQAQAETQTQSGTQASTPETTPLRPPISDGSPQTRQAPPRPSPNSTLEDLYPGSSSSLPYDASKQDPALSKKQNEEATQVQIAPVPISELLPIGGGKLPPIQLEASFNEPVSLKRVLEITLENSLPIRISQAGFESQRYLYYGALGRFVPDLILTYRGQRVDTPTAAPNTIFTTSTTVRYPVFQGGRIMYGAQAALYRSRAAKNAYSASVNDALLDAYKSYYNLLLNQTLLQIRVKSVELSRTQLKLNEQLKNAGVGTNFAIYQSRTQLALDKQALLQQQVLVRQAALTLARVLNTSMLINFIPQETVVRELKLIDPDVNVDNLVATTLKLRPELKQYENLRMAASRNIQVAQAPLYPTFQFFTSLTESKNSRNSGGSGSLAGSTVVIPTGSSGAGIGISGAGARSVSGRFRPELVDSQHGHTGYFQHTFSQSPGQASTLAGQSAVHNGHAGGALLLPEYAHGQRTGESGGGSRCFRCRAVAPGQSKSHLRSGHQP